MHHWMFSQPIKIVVRPQGMRPICTKAELPPLRKIIQRHRPIRLVEDQRSGPDHIRLNAGVKARIGNALGKGDKASFRNKAGEGAIGHRRFINLEWIDTDLPGGAFFGVMAI